MPINIQPRQARYIDRINRLIVSYRQQLTADPLAAAPPPRNTRGGYPVHPIFLGRPEDQKRCILHFLLILDISQLLIYS